MDTHYDDREYFNIVSDILDNNEFSKLSDIKHHGINRLDHSLRVSYFSYKICKFLRLNYKEAARAGLLHDFFFEKNEKVCKKDRAITLVKHPDYALENAKRYFDINDLEEDIITTHMFPIGRKLPKYMESWIVDTIDDIVAIYEKTHVTKKQLSFASTFLFLFLLNFKIK